MANSPNSRADTDRSDVHMKRTALTESIQLAASSRACATLSPRWRRTLSHTLLHTLTHTDPKGRRLSATSPLAAAFAHFCKSECQMIAREFPRLSEPRSAIVRVCRTVAWRTF
eukprot:6207569-Pleurochrysis_carterae.AAC.2